MTKAIIVYGSTTGNTELLSDYVADAMRDSGLDVTVRNVTDSDVYDLYGYDIIVLGSSSWGGGELQDDFIDFYDEMEGLFLGGKKAAAFGPGDGSYETFCKAVDLLENRLKECGADVVTPSLRVDGDVKAAKDRAYEWGRQLARSLAIA